MANTFNLVLREFCVACGNIIQLIPFVCAFYAFEFPLFYNHHNCEGDVTFIPFAMGTHQDDPLGRTLFALAHFTALCSIVNHFPFCLFPSIVDDIHIIGPPSIVSSIHEHFKIKFHAIGFSIQFQKYVTWSPFGLPFDFNTPF